MFDVEDKCDKYKCREVWSAECSHRKELMKHDRERIASELPRVRGKLHNLMKLFVAYLVGRQIM